MGAPSIRWLAGHLTVGDVVEWREWEEANGPVLLHDRIDAAAQRIAYTVHASAGGKEPPERFAQDWRKHGMTDDQAVKWLRVLAGGKK